MSPIEYGHVLLIPRVLECLPQRIDLDSLLLALHMAEEAASPYFRLGYNSLGAFATINHLHFQVINLLFSHEVHQNSETINNGKFRLYDNRLITYQCLSLLKRL